MTNANVALIGIGAMGAPMAARLAAAGLLTKVYDADADRLNDLAGQWGVAAAHSPAAAAEGVDVLITMLPTSAIVAEVLFGKDGAAERLSTGALVLEMSSGEPLVTRDLAQRLAQLGVDLADAPVSGGVLRAERGDLAVMVGGTVENFERALPVLSHLGKSIHRAGDVGAGQAMKALNNLVSATAFLVSAEAVDIGQKFGLDPEVMVDILNSSSGLTDASQRKMKQFVLNESYGSGFGLDLMVKDIGIALSLADGLGCRGELSHAAVDVWRAAQEELGRGRDHTEIAAYAARRDS